jgi:hypothetical protein
VVKNNDYVRVVPSENPLLQNPYVGRTGLVLSVDHPSAGLAGGLTVVLSSVHNGLGEKEHKKLVFLTEAQVELA